MMVGSLAAATAISPVAGERASSRFPGETGAPQGSSTITGSAPQRSTFCRIRSPKTPFRQMIAFLSRFKQVDKTGFHSGRPWGGNGNRYAVFRLQCIGHPSSRQISGRDGRSSAVPWLGERGLKYPKGQAHEEAFGWRE